MYIHQRKDWPHFNWDANTLIEPLAEVRYLQGKLLAGMESLGFQLREEANLQILTQDVIKTSAIEGETLKMDKVRSSIARRLGIDIGGAFAKDRQVEGIVDMMMDATRNYATPLIQDRLFGWHAVLFPTGRSGMHRITVGGWRTEASGAMQVVSGSHGREKVHYEAPSYQRVKKEMRLFLKWYETSSAMDPVLKAALAHFWFVTIHPFDDGNGRIARAIADMQLSRAEKSQQRFYSMSSQIQLERDDYYTILERCQKGTLNITAWMEWFLDCLKRAIQTSEVTLSFILIKASFWKTHAAQSLNARQKLMLNHLLDGLKDPLTSRKWAKITKCSPDTALRDISDLLTRNILVKEEAGGRSTRYHLNLEDTPNLFESKNN